MLVLDHTPRWIDLHEGVRVRVSFVGSSVMEEVWRTLYRDVDGAIEVEDAAEPEAREFSSVDLAKVVARHSILEWEGIGDAQGNPVAPSPEGIDALLEVPQILKAFRAQVVDPAMGIVAEGNALSPSPTGSSAGGGNTAVSAPPDAKTAPRKT